MANSGASNGFKLTLGGFILLSLLLMVATYMGFDQSAMNAAALRQSKSELAGTKNQVDRLARSVEAAQTTIGIKGADFDTTLEKLEGQLKNLGKDQAQGTVVGTLTAMDDKINNEQNRADGLQNELDEANTRMTQIDENAQAVISQEKDARAKAVRDLADVQQKSEEEISSIQKKNDELSETLQQLQTEFDQFRESAEEKERELVGQNRKLTNTNNRLQERLAQLEQISYERADGRIIRTDFDSGLVWINIGSSSGLIERTRFSVYLRKNRGMARGTDEIKGAIEVTEILGKHQAVARIIDEELGRPIAAGDPIYSPAWSAGGKLAISVVGLIDLDGDGQWDRDRFHELLQMNQAIIDNEVDDKGQRSGDGISANTKFLVVGEIPNISAVQQPKIDEKVVQDIAKAHQRMVAEAREQGVRVVTLRDFLQYLGYHPTQRIWMRTSGRIWNLKHGQRFSDAAIKSGKYQSTGTVSGLYTRNPKLPPYVSSGQVSKLYRRVKKQYP